MKIGLIYPSRSRKHTYSSSNPELQYFFESNHYVPSFYLPSLSLLTIAACTPQAEEIQLIDERTTQIDFEEPFDIVGISIITEQARRGYEIATEFRKRGVFTVLGGIHASVLPDEAKQFCDAVVVGEGEVSWPNLIKDFKQGTLKKFYLNPGQINLEQSPVPKYDLIDIGAYPFIPIQTTRGCPLDCSFCTVSKVYGPKLRNKKTDQVLRELEAILKLSKNRRIVFNDDNMFLNRAKSLELLEALRPLKIRYFTESDISIAEDERLLGLMGKSGCVTVFVGFESLVPKNLGSIQGNKWKLHHLKSYSEACKKIQDHGIQVLGAFILGFDHDRLEVFEDTIKFVLDNNILGQFHFMTPFPGTRVRETLIDEKRLAADDDRWDLYSCFDVVFSPKSMTKEELEDGLLNVYRRVYARDAYLKRARHMMETFKQGRQKTKGFF